MLPRDLGTVGRDSFRVVYWQPSQLRPGVAKQSRDDLTVLLDVRLHDHLLLAAHK